MWQAFAGYYLGMVDVMGRVPDVTSAQSYLQPLIDHIENGVMGDPGSILVEGGQLFLFVWSDETETPMCTVSPARMRKEREGGGLEDVASCLLPGYF